jgi:dTDP-3-amino-3,4,6-trideoxy-alpha-D-glucose transaminase
VTAVAVPFVNLRGSEDAASIRAAIDRVLARSWFVLGPEVEAFEQAFAESSGARYSVGVASGTDAVALLLRAAGIGRGDEVVVPALTAAFTALAVTSIGAIPVFADIDPERLTLDPGACATAVTGRTRAVIPVHLYGQSADMAAIGAVAEAHGLAVIEDCCQAHLATCDAVPVGTRGIGGAFSFYPTKNLGAIGDGGAVVTDDTAVAESVRRLRNGGQSRRDHHVEAGVNSRLDEIQAAVLLDRLPRLATWTHRRRHLAAAYRQQLAANVVRVLPECDAGHVYHLFPVRSPRRDQLAAHLRAEGVETLVHYPVALPEQPAFADHAPQACPVAAAAAAEVLSLPLRPDMTDGEVELVARAVNRFR